MIEIIIDGMEFFFFYSNIVNSRYHKEFVQEIIWLIIINVNNDSIWIIVFNNIGYYKI